MKKIIFLILAAVLTLSLFSLTAFAESEGAEVGESAAMTANGEAAVPTDGGESFFDQLYGTVMRHADEILSALAFVGSLLIAFAYKRGLLPIIKGALSNMSQATARLKDETKAATDKAAEALAHAGDKLSEAERMLVAMAERLEELNAKLDAARENEERYGEMKLILSSQIDMLYEIFISSSLPAYQKEAIGARISEMKKKLTPCQENAPEP